MPKRASLNHAGVGRLSTESQVGSYFCANSGAVRNEKSTAIRRHRFIESPLTCRKKPASVREQKRALVKGEASAQNMNLNPNWRIRASWALEPTTPKLFELLMSPLG